MSYKQLSNPVIGHLFALNVIIILSTFLITKFSNADISKYIISIFIPISLVLGGAYGKSLGITNNLILYLSPRMLLTITILIPILLFGYRELKKTIYAVTPGIIVFILYDKIHSLFGIELKNLPFEPQYYGMFVVMIILFLIFVLLSILSLQSVNLKSELKLQRINDELTASEEELKQQNEEILAINDDLEQQQKIILEQKNEMQKLLTAVEQSENSIIITDTKGKIEYANPIFSSLTGYNKNEVIGANPSVLKSGHHKNEFYKTLWTKINDGKVWSGTFKNKKKNGELYWEQATISPIKNSNGEITNFVAIKEDITKRKESERKLSEAFKTIKEKNDDITKSINYAKRIQTAISSSENILKNNFTDFLLINKPLKIVGGDFYHFIETDKEIIIAVADCTGHGVPGGFMTMLGHAFLDDIINIRNITKTGQILDELRSKIINSLGQTETFGSSRDGMDIAICKIEKETLKSQYSGAYNPILIIRDGHEEVIKGDKMPIGIYPKIKPFTTHSIELQKNDLIYMFSDGFQDQFGGTHNQKYKINKFQKLLIANSEMPLSNQKQIIETELQNWMGNNAQLDDILILGVKI